MSSSGPLLKTGSTATRFPIQPLHMSPSLEEDYSKGERCDQLGVQFFVDDHYPNCIDTAESGRVYPLFPRLTTSISLAHLRLPVYNWREIAQHIAALTG